MKKSKVKWEIKQSMKLFYKNELTNTANKVQQELLNKLDKIWK